MTPLWPVTLAQEGTVTEVPGPVDGFTVTAGTTQSPRPLPGIDIECNSNTIQITLGQQHNFNGMIYPKVKTLRSFFIQLD